MIGVMLQQGSPGAIGSTWAVLVASDLGRIEHTRFGKRRNAA